MKQECKYLKCETPVDVLVLGSGIAGISAAIAASESGKRIALACRGRLFSGSSFYPGTWGLGLIGPEDKSDEKDLEETIQYVGCGMAQDELVKAFVSGIHPAIERVEKMGVKLKKAQAGAKQQEYIPCFDHKHRDWNGIEFDRAKKVFGEKLALNHVTLLEGYEVLELTKKSGRVCGAVISNGDEIAYIAAKTVVLATGGYGSLFQHHLCTSDVEGMGQGLALDVGCRLINMEFMQIMPGYLHPAYGTVFNEKVFRFTELEANGKKILEDHQEILEKRSGHGPFTSRLESREVDLAIDSEKEGVTVHYRSEIKEDPPEFVQTYFEWLKESKGLTIDDPIRIGLFAHAANGGIWIQKDGFTGVPGLYAAGEVTGGMHGADRIGGLSTANGLVFGTKAGMAAAKESENISNVPAVYAFDMIGIENHALYFKKLQQLMTENAMAVRCEEGLLNALKGVWKIEDAMKEEYTDSILEVAAFRRLRAQLKTATAILKSQLLRKESRGSHYREDYPFENPEFNRCIIIQESEDGIQLAFSHQ